MAQRSRVASTSITRRRFLEKASALGTFHGHSNDNGGLRPKTIALNQLLARCAALFANRRTLYMLLHQILHHIGPERTQYAAVEV